VKGSVTPSWVRVPSPPTLRRYGLTEEDWLALFEAQGWKCPICLRSGARLTMNVDHQHVPQWKHMPPEERRRYVRGILCVFDNYRRVHSEMGAEEAQRVADYFKAYEARRDRET
jgi:Recombination endonuclease VII